MGRAFFVCCTFRTRLSIVALLLPFPANNNVVAAVLSSGLYPCVPNRGHHEKVLKGRHASFEGQPKLVVSMEYLYLHNGVERHLPLLVEITTVYSVAVLRSPSNYHHHLLPLVDQCCHLVSAVSWKCLGHSVVPLGFPSWTTTFPLRYHLHRPSCPHLRFGLVSAGGSREGVVVGCPRCCADDPVGA